MNGLGLHTPGGQVAAHQDVVGGGHTAPGDVGQGAHRALGGGEAEGGAGEAQGQVLDGVDPGVQEQVAAGDAGVDGALTDVDGDVARPQEEQLDVVGLVDEHELAAGTAGAVARLGEHGDGGVGQGALVRDSNTQHSGS